MKKIICPTDFSELADKGIAYAAKVTQRIGGTLTLFNVQSLQDRTLTEALMGREYNSQKATELLATQCDQVRKAFRISCEAEVQAAVGSPIAVIAEQASAYDLIVMSTNGPADLVQFLIGSHTYRLARTSATALLLIPRECGFSEIKRIVFAYDYLKNKSLPVGQVLDFARAVGGEVTVVNVMTGPYSREAEVQLEDLQHQTREQYPDAVLHFKTIYSGELVTSLHDFIIQNEIDVLALCTEDRSFVESLFHKSTIKTMSVIADYPVLITHR